MVLMIALPIGLYIALDADPFLIEFRYFAWYFIILPLGALVGWFFVYQQNLKGIIYSLATSWYILLLFFFYLLFPKLDQKNPVQMALKALPEDARLVGHHVFNSSFVFYADRPIPKIHNQSEFTKHLHDSDTYIIRKHDLKEDSLTSYPIFFEQIELFEPVQVVIPHGEASQKDSLSLDETGKEIKP